MFTEKRVLNLSYIISCFLALFLSTPFCRAQGLSNSGYGNEWLDFSKTYVKIRVESPGIQRVAIKDLPPEISKTEPEKLQLWYRGEEVNIIESNKDEIIFYGIGNDGSSDSLVYRPHSARLNKHVSLYSEHGIYFLTGSDAPVKRSRVIDGTKSISSQPGEPTAIQTEKLVKTFSSQFSFATYSTSAALNNSFYEEGNSWTGPTIAGATGTSVKDTVLDLKIELKGFLAKPDLAPTIELLFFGLSLGEHPINIEVSPNENDWRLLENLNLSGWSGKKSRILLKNSDVSNDGLVYLKVRTSSGRNNDWFSLSYYSVEYAKLPNYTDSASNRYHFAATSEKNRQIIISNTSSNLKVFDITKANDVNIVTGKHSNLGQIELNLSTVEDQMLDLLIVSEENFKNVAKSEISLVDFSPMYAFNEADVSHSSALDFDYYIITTSQLRDGANEYAEYRSSMQGGGYKVLMMDINTIYTIYNYGEPSPIAIKAFMKHMLGKGTNTRRKNLLLIGPSVTYPGTARKELENEVPSIGDPASDLLLVAGLSGKSEDSPALPVGRIKAFNSNEIVHYLNKVIEYEHEQSNIFWRKRALHISGGESTSQIGTLRQILEGIVPHIEQSEFSGKVKSLTKSSTSPVQRIDISEDVNDGIGLLSFFGHGAQQVTDMDFGYVSDVSRRYDNKSKYPLMYFNGCGVGNIFTSRTTHILTDDWIVTPDKGAIAILANSYKSYITTSARHISTFYKVLFEDQSVETIGEIWKKTAETILSISGQSSYDIANVHQVCLQGDPAIKIFRIQQPDYIVSRDGIYLYGESDKTFIKDSRNGRLAIVLQNGGQYHANGSIPIQISKFYDNGITEKSTFSVASVAFQDTIWVPINNVDNNLVRIEVQIDPQKEIDEFTRENNITDLLIDWSKIDTNHTYYPTNPIIDRIPPRILVSFNGKAIREKGSTAVNSKVEVILDDDQSMTEDISRINIYLKNCWDDSCEFTTIPPSDYSIKVVSGTTHIFSFYLPKELATGEYQLYVVGRDNSSSQNSVDYIRNFEITAADSLLRPVTFIASPNPSTSYIKLEPSRPVYYKEGKVTWKIKNIRGETIFESSQELQNSFLNEWYFQFERSNLQGGIYFYEVIAEEADKLKQENKIRRRGRFIVY